jgi:hypothetical protein
VLSIKLVSEHFVFQLSEAPLLLSNCPSQFIPCYLFAEETGSVVLGLVGDTWPKCIPFVSFTKSLPLEGLVDVKMISAG